MRMQRLDGRMVARIEGGDVGPQTEQVAVRRSRDAATGLDLPDRPGHGEAV